MLQITSVRFIAAMLVIPFICRSKYFRYLFLLLNIAVYALPDFELQSLIAAALFLLVPYLLCRTGLKSGIIFALLIVTFIYLKGYNWLLAVVGVNEGFPWEILGISYMLFRTIDYCRVYPQLDKKQRSLVDYLNYQLSVYTILCGPIISYQAFYEDFAKEKHLCQKEELLSQLNRITNGYIKVVLLSYLLNTVAGNLFQSLSDNFNVLTFAGFAFLNFWYIYFNFSGYCDVVIGFGKIAGFTIPENFKQPYAAENCSQFWNRWHMTLSHFLKDNIYIPLGGNRVGELRKIINVLVVWLVSGLWHGTTVNYLFFGLLEALGVLVANKLKTGHKGTGKIRKITEMIICQVYIMLTFTLIGYDVVNLIVEQFVK